MLNSTHVIASEKQSVVQFVCTSEKGPVRDRNEDSLAVVNFSDQGLPEKGTLLIVADGMGGMEAGEHASAMVTTLLPWIYLENANPNPQESLSESIVEMNRLVYEEGRRTYEEKGFGTTTVAALIVGSALVVINVGDSRAYLFRNGTLKLLSRDHAMDSMYFNPFSPSVRNLSHVLTQAIGPQRIVQPHLYCGNIAAGDTLVLCSDGLTSAVSDMEIQNTLNTTGFDLVAEKLIHQAEANHSDDNISVVAARLVTSEVLKMEKD
ncbi:MAG: serine/threonine-protein phosphatase [Bacteroidetes bacterium]|nr:serine/threonine-protein phosphatase [Bacteroidota bacterium]MCW5894358.1 serine/threonine-protein phosphatase [Bacteroidota bacterium]